MAPRCWRRGMDGFDARAYGADWAAVYDDVHEGMVDTDATVAGLAELVGPAAAVLEYAAGTGRLAIPLAERGHDVVAVEISEPMLEQLRAQARRRPGDRGAGRHDHGGARAHLRSRVPRLQLDLGAGHAGGSGAPVRQRGRAPAPRRAVRAARRSFPGIRSRGSCSSTATGSRSRPARSTP